MRSEIGAWKLSTERLEADVCTLAAASSAKPPIACNQCACTFASSPPATQDTITTAQGSRLDRDLAITALATLDHVGTFDG